MPPFATFLLTARAFVPGLPSQEFREQFQHPKEVFSVLLILGGDVVARWVAYGVSAVVSAVGENKLMPQPDVSCIVINGNNGYTRANTSWVIGRLVRDYESWMDVQELDQEREDERLHNTKGTEGELEAEAVPEAKVASLCVSIYEAKEGAGKPSIDAIYLAGLGTAVVQLGVAAIPCGLYGDWGILMVTAFGILLSFLTGSLAQWKDEKWAGRKNSQKEIILTRRNGSQHAIVILGKGIGIDLEDLAATGNSTDTSASRTTRLIMIMLAGAWIFLLITAAALDQNNWFLLLVGAIGILQNILAAGGHTGGVCESFWRAKSNGDALQSRAETFRCRTQHAGDILPRRESAVKRKGKVA